MATLRWDETWHRLLEWTNDQGPSERLAAQVLIHEGFEDIDPSHPLGGKDGGKDALCTKDGLRWALGVFFPRGQQDFSVTRKKFAADAEAIKSCMPNGFVFVTNQELRLAERAELEKMFDGQVEIYHLERVTAVLDDPRMQAVRKQFLSIDYTPDEGRGGDGGSGTIIGDRGSVIGGRGGPGGVGGRGGDGGGGFVIGDDGLIVGGDGGSCGTVDGRGGRGARGPIEAVNGPSSDWHIGRGGAGANAPEYDRRLILLVSFRIEYLNKFPDQRRFIEGGIDPVPVTWINKRLEETGESWRIEWGEYGYNMPALRQE